jgi:hypothetical protein
MYFFHAITFKTYSNKNKSENSAIFSYLGAELFKLSTIGGTFPLGPRLVSQKKRNNAAGEDTREKLNLKKMFHAKRRVRFPGGSFVAGHREKRPPQVRLFLFYGNR